MATVSFPARCAVSVVCGEHLVSQVYPASVPVEAFIDSAVELLGDDLRRRGWDTLDSATGFEFHRANGTRLDITKTLDELGVEDGATLVLAQAVDGDSFVPQCESLSTGLAREGKRLFEPVTAETAAHTGLAILAMTLLSILGLAVYTRADSGSPAPAVLSITLGILTAAGTFAVWRWWPQRSDLLNSLGWLTVPMLAIGFALAAPGELGSAHFFIGALSTAILAVGITRITQQLVSLAACIVTLCSVGAAAAAARMSTSVPSQRLGMCILIGLLLLLTLAPTLALRAARIRPPHFGSITGRDLFRRDDDMPVDAVMPVEETPDEDPARDMTPRGEVIAGAAKRANSVLTGICLAAAVTLPVATWMTVMPGSPRGTAAALLAVLFAVIFLSRARAFADRRQAVALSCGAAAAVCAGAARYVVHFQGVSTAAFLWGAGAAACFGAAALAAALLVPSTRFTPLVRMVIEWLELVAVVVALPLAAWISGLFAWVRMR